VELELARQLFDPDPQIRKHLAELLPSLQSIDAAPWLLALCRDEDAEVRLIAVSLIATSGDPALKAEAERIARRDADPRLKNQAQRMTKPGKTTLR
jgi:HEAT repeat protein